MTVQQAFYRGNNLVGTAIVALAGFAFLPEFFLEDEHTHKIDDGLLFLLGVTAVVWWRVSKNRYAKSLVPVGLVVAALVVKIGALFIEFSDKGDVGDDMGALILFVLATILVVTLYRRKAPQS